MYYLPTHPISPLVLQNNQQQAKHGIPIQSISPLKSRIICTKLHDHSFHLNMIDAAQRSPKSTQC